MDYLKRISRLQEKFQQYQLDAFLITNLTDILYFTGLKLSAGKILATSHEVHLIVDGRYIELCKKNSPLPVLLSDEKVLWTLLDKVNRLGVDGEVLSHLSFLDLQKESLKQNIELIPLKGLVHSLRAIKDPSEIALLREAAELGSLGFDFVLNSLKQGISEEELSLDLEIYWRKKGAFGVSFEPIIAFGVHSSMPHYRAGKAKLKKGDIVLIDIGVNLNHYHSDMTRVAFFGDVDPKLKEVREIVEKAYKAALTLCRSEVETAELDTAARGLITAAGYGNYFTHSLGHGIGLDVHELPLLKKSPNYILKEGMAITIEPGIYLPGLGGVRIEDTIVITHDSYENLTNRETYFLIDV